MEALQKYTRDIEAGLIPSCDEVKQAVQRFKNDLQRDDLIFDWGKVQRVITFISCLEHSTGKHSGKPFILEPWQVFIVANLYGFFWKETGLRRFTSSYLEVSRKNGKTAFAAALCLYHLIADNEGNAEVLLAANSKDQAKIAFEITSLFSKKLDPAQKDLVNYRSEIKFKPTDSILRVLAADDTKLDGFNASFALLDEYHAAKTSKVRDVLKSSQGMRLQPHIATITTAGFDKSLPCYQLRTVGKEILQGLKQDDSMFVTIFTLDKSDKWQDPKNWIKANPNLGVTVRENYLKEQSQQAINNPSDETGFRTKNLNEWVSSSNVWLSDDIILKNSTDLTVDRFKGKGCYLGVDLAAVRDFVAVSLLFPEDDFYYFLTWYYLPEDSLNTLENKELYKTWAKQGFLKLTPGNVCDYDIILNDILELSKTVQIMNVAYDSWNATQWAISATSHGIPLKPFSQALGSFNQATKEFERLILSGQIKIDNNPVTRYCFKNVVLKIGKNQNSKPEKASRNHKIDGVISKLMALGGLLNSGNTETHIY